MRRRSDDSQEHDTSSYQRFQAMVLRRLIPVVVGTLAIVILIESFSLGIGELARPGPGMWPAAVSLLTVVAAAVLALRGTPWDPAPSGGAKWSAVTMISFVIYIAVLPFMGFIASTVPLGYVLTRVVGGATIRTSIITAVGAPVCTYLLFEVALGVPLIGSRLW